MGLDSVDHFVQLQAASNGNASRLRKAKVQRSMQNHYRLEWKRIRCSARSEVLQEVWIR